MFCPNCGKEISDTAKVCGYCGTKLLQAESPAPQPAAETKVESEPVVHPPEMEQEISVSEPEPEPIPVPLEKDSEPVVQPASQAAAKVRKPLPRWAWWVIGLPIAIGVNFLFGYLYSTGVNFALDMLGTIIITVILGPVAGVIAGISLCLIATFTYYELSYYFIPVHILLALGAWVTYKNGWFRSIWKTIVSSFVIIVLVPIVGSIIVLFVYYAPQDRSFAALIELFLNTLLNPRQLHLTGIYLLIWLGLRILKPVDNMKKEPA